MSIRVTRDVGRYNFASPSEYQAQWVIWMPKETGMKNLSVMVEPDGEHDPEGEDDPWEVIDYLEAKIDGLWISTSRDKDKEIIKYIRDNEETLRPEWIRSKIEAAQKRKEKAQKDIDYWGNELDLWVEEETA